MNDDRLNNLCDELKPLLQHELDRGNTVLSVETGWSKVTLAVRLSKPLDVEFIQQAVEGNPGLELWENRDNRYPQESGVLCRVHQQSISGALGD